MGWLFDREQTNAQRFAPDLLADNDIRRIDALFPALTMVILLAPAVLGGLITMSLWDALTRVLLGQLRAELEGPATSAVSAPDRLRR